MLSNLEKISDSNEAGLWSDMKIIAIMAIILRARLPRLPRLLYLGHTEDFSPQKLHNMEI